MSRVKALRVLVGIAALLPACGDEGITGYWHGELTVTVGGKIWLSIEESDESVAGSAEYVDPDEDFQTEAFGSVRGAKVELDFPDLEGSPHYAAGFQGNDEMTGTWTRFGSSEKLTVKRRKE